MPHVSSLYLASEVQLMDFLLTLVYVYMLLLHAQCYYVSSDIGIGHDSIQSVLE